ncbi:toll/interleukin-1 receptor domain-containing protein [Streptomyces sp. PA03-6a]|nr:toll/interleukin-1 receptor domain-containing protein [Streptomyces sp. PA03-6a]
MNGTSSRPLVFLSRSEPPGCTCTCWPARRSVIGLLEAAGCEPIVIDRQTLVPGQDWMEAISDGMGNAHGMVLLASPHAVESPHVQNELAMAELRNRHDGFPIILVLLPEVDREGLEASRLGSLSPTRRQNIDWPVDGDLADVVRDITPQLELMRAQVNEDRVHQRVVQHLREVDGPVLSRAGDRLGVSREILLPLMHHRVAEGLLTERRSEPQDDPLRAALTELLPLQATSGSREVIELSVTHARVPASDSRRINEVLTAPAAPRAAVLPAHSTETARRFVHRASGQPVAWDHFVVPIDVGSGVAESLIAGVRDHLTEVDVHDLETLLQHEHDFGPVVVIVPHPPDPDLVARLGEEFPAGVLFLFVVDGDLVGTAPDPLPRLQGLPRPHEEEMNRTIRTFVRRYAGRN